MRIKRHLVVLALSFLGLISGASSVMADGPIDWAPGGPWNNPTPVGTAKPQLTELKPVIQNQGPTARQVQIVNMTAGEFNCWSRWHTRRGWANPVQKLNGRVLLNTVLPSYTSGQPFDRLVNNRVRPFVLVLARDTDAMAGTWDTWFLPAVNSRPWQVVGVGRLQKDAGGIVDGTIDVRTPVHGVTVDNQTGAQFASYEFVYQNGKIQKGPLSLLAGTTSLEILPELSGVPFTAKFKVAGTSGVVFTVSDAQTWDGFNAVTITAVAPPPPPSTTVTFGNDTADGIVFGSYILQYEDGTSKTDSFGPLAFGQRQAVVAKSGLRFTAQLVVSSSSVSGVSPGSKFRYLTESGYDDPATSATNESQVLGDAADQLTQFNALAVGGNLDLIAN